MSLLVVVGLPVDVPAAAQPATFPRYKELEPNVEFWRRVFSTWTSSQIVFHDPEHLSIVYSILDASDIDLEGDDSAAGRRELEKRRTAERKRLEGMLRSLAKAAPTHDEGRRLDALIRQAGHERVYAAKLAERIRSQRGMGNRLCDTVARARHYQPMMWGVFREAGLPGKN